MIEDFFRIAARLKDVPRQGWMDKMGMERPESVADHTFLTAVMGMTIADLENLDSEKVLRMILLHDLAESGVGDITPDQMTSEEKQELEDSEFDRIAGDLPEEIRSRYGDVWREYRENSSAESSLVHQLDKLEMALQAMIYRSRGHKNTEPFLETARSGITHPRLKELFAEITGGQ